MKETIPCDRMALSLYTPEQGRSNVPPPLDNLKTAFFTLAYCLTGKKAIMDGSFRTRGQLCDPNFDGAPQLPPFDSKSGEYFEIGVSADLRPVSERIRTLESIMRRIVGEQN